MSHSFWNNVFVVHFRRTAVFFFNEIQRKSVRNLNMIMKIVAQVYILSLPVCVFISLHFCALRLCSLRFLRFFNVVICKWCFSSLEIGSLLLLLLLTCSQVLWFQYGCVNILLFFVESSISREREKEISRFVVFLWIQPFIVITPWR